ncbi:hypothetical protein P389DRAFT_207177 [Cystobasidium minutum MCA 4210]|uniref:uncharacterized protein n=1 Tax=Cystobasidium minutum MCA 4210 TaxID=1397322 RepID=UPI0034CF3072|eukprot:jgi/Rhomi1/207177/estExt_Genemark1.C_1_t10042
MTLFRQGRTSPKSSSKGVKLPSLFSGNNETGPEQSTSTSTSAVYQHSSDSTRPYHTPTRGDSINSIASNDSASSSSSATSTNSSTCSINGPIGLQGALLRNIPTNETGRNPLASASSAAPSARRTSPIPSHRPPLVGSAPSESGRQEAAIPQVSRYGRVLPSTHEFRGQGATIPCLAYSTPRPVVASEDYCSPPPYDALFGSPLQTHDAVFRSSTRQAQRSN